MKRLVCFGVAMALALVKTIHAQPTPTPPPGNGSGSGSGTKGTNEQAGTSLENGGDDRPWAKGVSRAEQSTALELFRQGNVQLNDGIFVEAEKKYKEALKHWDHPAIHYNLALAQINLDHPLEVEDNLNAAMKFGAAPLDKDKFDHAKEYLVLNAKQIGKIEVSTESKGAKVTIDGKYAFTGPGKQEQRVRAGRHSFAAAGPGYTTRFRAPFIGGGETFRIELKLYTPEELTRYRRKWDKTWIPYSVIGGGLVVAGLGGIFELAARSNYNDFDKKVAACNTSGNGMGCMATSDLTSIKSSGDTKKTLGYIGYGVGLGAMATGLVMVYLNRREAYQIHPDELKEDDNGGGGSAEPPAVTVAPMIGPDVAGAMVFGHF